MRARKTSNLRRVRAYLRRCTANVASAVAGRTLHLFRRGLILCYHRVCDFRHDPQLLCVTPERFEQQLRHLVAHYEPVTLAEISGGRRGRRPLVAVTFDDGYVDNYSFARPLLKKYSVPAIVFTSSGFCGSDANFYWDELFDLLMFRAIQQEHVSEVFGLSLNGLPPDSPEMARTDWNVLSPDTPSWRHAAYSELCSRLRFCRHAARESALHQLCVRADVARMVDATRRVMNAHELRACQESGVLDIGAHTITHASLSALPAEEIRAEVIGAKTTLEQHVGRPIREFSYPYGDHREFADATAAVIAEADFDRICVNVPGLMLPATSPCKLPRFLVRNWDQPEFAARLSGWLATPGPVSF